MKMMEMRFWLGSGRSPSEDQIMVDVLEIRAGKQMEEQG